MRTEAAGLPHRDASTAAGELRVPDAISLSLARAE